MKQKLLFTLTLIFLLSSCASYADENNPLATPLPSATLLPSFALTPQVAQANAQATISAGQAMRSDLDITATALAIQGIEANQRATEVAIQVTQAMATSEAFIQQTEISSRTTATAQAQIDATHAANMASTQSFAKTATVWAKTATPLSATQNAIVLEVKRAERKAYWSQMLIPFWVLIGAILFIVFIIGIIYTYRRLLRIFELRLGVFSSDDGEMNLILPADEDVKLLLPGRSFGSAMHSGKDETVISGIAPNLGLQDRVVARNQAIRLTASLPPGRTPQQVQKILAPPQDGDAAQSQNLPLIEIVDAEVVPVKNWVEEVSTKFLEEE